MAGGAGRGGATSPARRPGGALLIALAVLLLVGGGTAVVIGVAGQDSDPPTPSATSSTTGSRSSASMDASADDSTATGTAPDAPSSTAPAPAPTAPLPVALPVSVSIPAIQVQSELLTLGLNPDGTLAVPASGPDYDKAAWFDGSPRPGQAGPAVIEGHVDSVANGPSVFYSLGTLAAGDRIDVTREDGSVVTFVVNEVRLVPKDDFPTLDVYGNTDGPELRLITCGGPFDSSVRSYEDNVVVFASQAP